MLPVTERAFSQVSQTDSVLQKYEHYQEMKPGLYRVIDNGKTGVVNQEGKVIVPFRYDQVWTPTKDQFIRVLKNMKTGLYHLDKGLILPAEYDQIWNFENGLAKIMQDGKFGFINSEGQMTVPCEYQHVKGPDNGRIRVIQNGRTGYLTSKGEIIIPPIYQHIGTFENGKARVIRDGKTGIIDEDGQEIIPAIYDRIGQFNNREAIAIKNGQHFKIDTTGQTIEQISKPETTTDTISEKSGRPSSPQQPRISIEKNQIEIRHRERNERKSGKKPRNPSFEGHLGGFGLALNGYMDENGREELPDSYGFMQLNQGKSMEVSIYPFQKDLRLIGSWFGLTTGIGLQYNNYRFNLESPGDIDEAGKDWFPETDPEASITKSKLMVLHGKIPVMAEIQIPNGQSGEVFFMSGGITGDVRLQTHTKLVHHSANGREKKKKRGDMGIPTFRYGYMARAGHGSFSLYATYYPRSMFKDGEEPTIYPYSVGIMLNF